MKFPEPSRAVPERFSPRSPGLIASGLCFLLSLTGIPGLHAQEAAKDYNAVAGKLLEAGLKNCEAYSLLEELTSKAGPRLSGSPGAAKAVELTREMMESRGFENVHLEEIQVPHWVRGDIERAAVVDPSGNDRELTVCALGGSVGTPEEGVEGEVIEVKSFDELKGKDAAGKIVFFNRPFDASLVNTFAAYGGAVEQRGNGAIEAAKAGGIAALVRSMTLAHDDVPHTGTMHYADDVPKVPAAAVSSVDADYLSGLLRSRASVVVRLQLSAQTLPDVPSANVVGQLTGTEFPDEIIVVCGHLDSWDKGTGAHDDGSGSVQAIEAVRLLKQLGLRPKRTIRAVLYMNEENGLRGGRGYAAAPERRNEKQFAAIESDAGGFAPRGISVQADSAVLMKVQSWSDIFRQFEAGDINPGYSGVDISPLVEKGVPGFGLHVENQRYFDYHHSDNDTIDKVNRRELELGAIVEAMFCYLVSEEGL